MNNIYHIIGVMSGTSLDGVDLVKCIIRKDKTWKYKIESHETIKYSKYWYNKLKYLHLKTHAEIQKADEEYGAFLGEKINNHIIQNNVKCDYISSHGHTIFHQPKNSLTLQIGNGRIISDITKITTINNFRQLDVKLKGQGAPLVPIGDSLLFPEYKYCLNLGGFANISFKENNKIIAFDICPVNYVLNFLSNKKGLKYDNFGKLSRSGTINTKLLQKLNNLNFYDLNYPKSLSREWVEIYIFPILNKQDLSIEDQLCTFCEHISIQIGKFLKDNEVLITGGGAINKYLIDRLSTKASSKLIIPEKKLINYKEALIFAFLGVLRLKNINNCLKSVTGAKRNSCSGDIYTK